MSRIKDNKINKNQKALGGNLFANGSWMPNKQWQNRISAWEGSSMYRPAPDTGRVNSSFQAEANRFLSVLPKKALQKLPEQAINALYSYSYNVGAGNFKKRVVPVLNKYLDGKASLQQVTNSMYATKDSQLRGLQKRRRYERGAFEAAITGKDLTGTNAYQQYDPLTGNYQSSNSPATKRRNIQWTDTINLNDGSLIQPNQQAPSLMQQLAHSEEILAEANKRINQATTRMMPDAQSTDPYINAIYNSSIQDNREQLADDLKNAIESSILKDNNFNNFIFNNENKFEAGGKIIIKKGDTLSKIAKNYNTDVDTLANLNSIKNKDLIFAGDSLILPENINPQNTNINVSTNTNETYINQNNNDLVSTKNFPVFYRSQVLNDLFTDKNYITKNKAKNFKNDDKVFIDNDGLIRNANLTFLTPEDRTAILTKDDILKINNDRLKSLGYNKNTLLKAAEENDGFITALVDNKTHTFKGFSKETNNLPEANINVLSKKSLASLVAASQNNDEAKVKLNTYLATKGNSIPEKWKKELGITDTTINHLKNYYENESLKNSETGKYYFNKDANVLRDYINKDRYISEKAMPFALRTAGAIMTGGGTELTLPLALAGTELITPKSFKVPSALNKLWYQTNLSSMTNVENPYLATLLDFGQSLGKSAKEMSVAQLATGLGSQLGVEGMYQASNEGKNNTSLNNDYTRAALAALSFIGPTKGKVGNNLGTIARQANTAVNGFVAQIPSIWLHDAGMIDDDTYNVARTVVPIAAYKTRNFYNGMKKGAKTTEGRSSFSVNGALAGIRDRYKAAWEQGYKNVVNRTAQEWLDTMRGKQYERATAESTGYTGVSATRRGATQDDSLLGRTSNNARVGDLAVYDNTGTLNKERTIGRTSIDLMFDDMSGVKVGDKTAYGSISRVVDTNDALVTDIYGNYFKGKKGKVIFNELDSKTGVALNGGKVLFWDKELPENSKLIGNASITKSDKAWTVGKDTTGGTVAFNNGGAHLLIYEAPDGTRYCKMSDATAAHIRQDRYMNLTNKQKADIKSKAGFSSNMQDDLALIRQQPLEVGKTVTLGKGKHKFSYTLTEADLSTETIDDKKVVSLKSNSNLQKALSKHRENLLESAKAADKSRKAWMSNIVESLQNNVVTETKAMPLERFLSRIDSMKFLSEDEKAAIKKYATTN